ncbi:DUF881 domain-containing protein [Jonesia quinghaiensis]|uniref:DUF881 domain-containing protein n=1 Tax=Jonesia quinghaiensis TaxID=262806 RepID=UPI0004180BED|nr:DUF881 domain-containing protein [Jonesia quinghaiensis]
MSNEPSHASSATSPDHAVDDEAIAEQESAEPSAPSTRSSLSSDETGNETPEDNMRTSDDQPVTPPVRSMVGLLKPRVTRAQILSAVLLGLLGFALVVQLQISQQDEFASLRQTDLVNLLDDVTRRNSDLEDEIVRLRALENELQSGSSSQRAALDAARQDVETQGILSGRLPAEGSGVTILLTEGSNPLPAASLFNVLEELRNAGAETVEVNGIRIVTSSYFVDNSQGVVIDGQVTTAPYVWKAIGDPKTLVPALEIPGGAMATVRSRGGDASITESEIVAIESVVELEGLEFATPQETQD